MGLQAHEKHKDNPGFSPGLLSGASRFSSANRQLVFCFRGDLLLTIDQRPSTCWKCYPYLGMSVAVSGIVRPLASALRCLSSSSANVLQSEWHSSISSLDCAINTQERF